MKPANTERADGATSVEAFGRLCAALDDPFADRSAVLAASGLNEQTLAAAYGRWSAALAADDGSLGERFANAYRGAREDETAALVDGTEDTAEDPQDSEDKSADPDLTVVRATAETPSYLRPPTPVPPKPVPPAPAPRVGLLPGVVGMSTGTTEVNLDEILKKPVPFDPMAKSQLPPPESKEAKEAKAEAQKAQQAQGAQEKPRRDAALETVELDVVAILKERIPPQFQRAKPQKTTPLPAMPEPPAAKAPTGRLVRFDPQTGAPLAVPYWEELSPKNKP